MQLIKPCLRCLLADMPDAAALAKSLRELIDLIPEGDRTPPDQERQRLNACRACEHLNRGTCSLCGCYVEHRAAKVRSDCPDVPSRWEKVSLPL